MAKTSNGWGRWVLLLIFALLFASYWLGLWPGAHHLSARKVYHQMAWPLVRLLIYMGIGLLLGQAIESLGWAAKLGSWAAPLLRWGHLHKESGASFTAAFFSGIMANTMLVTLYQEGRISRRELTITYLFNNGLPVYLLHLPTTFFIILPLTRQAGLIYLGLTLAAALLRSAALLVYSRWRLPADTRDESKVVATAPRKKEGLVQEIWQKFHRRFTRVIFFTLPIYFLIFVLNDMGFFKWLRDAAAAHVSLGFLPMEAASVVIFSVATEFTSGIAAAGAFLQAGALTVPQTVMALVLGNVVATPVRALRHQLPANVGIFSPKLGTELLLWSQGLRLLSLLLVAVPYAVWIGGA
ncbi:MAG: nucleoside recognition domain-containing protein [Deltaproteobacteria bacterium]|nr:nucleoside recognition domain-containing protein [Deltaproteobacteria bacterium]